MKEFVVTFSKTGTYKTKVLAYDEQDAMEKVENGNYASCESDGWEDEIEVFNTEEVESV